MRARSGNDAFIVTRAQLVPEDRNDAYDLYDARVDGVDRSPPACTGTGCQGVPAPPPTFATPPSVTFNGVGNFPPPTERRLRRSPKPRPKRFDPRAEAGESPEGVQQAAEGRKA